jgi:hypothetical protein
MQNGPLEPVYVYSQRQSDKGYSYSLLESQQAHQTYTLLISWGKPRSARPPIRTVTTCLVSGLSLCSRSRTPEVAMGTLICSRSSLWLLLAYKSKVSSTVLLIFLLSFPSTTFYTDWVALYFLFFALGALTSYEPTRKLPFDTTSYHFFRLTVLFPILTK